MAINLGALWSICNLFLIKVLIQNIFNITKKNYWKIYGVLIIKLPVLYLGGYGLLKIANLPFIYFLMGFSLTFVVLLAISFRQAYLPQAASEKG